jgi:hypothetical protein
MSEGRLKPRFTAAQGQQLEALGAELGLRSAQVAERLLRRKLSRVPLVNRTLWSELARTRANLTQLQRYLGQLPAAPDELVRQVEVLQQELGAYRNHLLGLSRERLEGHDTTEDDEGLQEGP